MKHKKYKPDLEGWNLEAWDKIKEALMPFVQKATEEAVHLLLTDEETYIYFPVEWAPGSDGLGGKPPSDPLTVYLRLASNGLEDATYKFDLKKALVDTDSSFSEGLTLLSAALRKWADEIDASIKPGGSRRARARLSA